MQIVLLAMGLAVLVKVPIASIFIVGQFPKLLEDSAHVLGNTLGSVKQVVEGPPYHPAILGAAVFLAILPLSPPLNIALRMDHTVRLSMENFGWKRSFHFKLFVII